MIERDIRSGNTATALFISLVFMIPIVGFGSEEKSPQGQFSNSCATDLQEYFSRAITLLHSVEYPESTRLFGEITNEDPDCAMAYWDAAMSIWHPLWAPPSKSDLERGAALLAIAVNLESTPREASYIDALSIFFPAMTFAAVATERVHTSRA